MRIDLQTAEAWRTVSERFRAALPFQDGGVQVHVYAGYQHALQEAAHGIARLFSHKKSLALFEKSEPALEALAVEFSAESYRVHHWGGDVDTIDATDLAFVLLSDDDPVVGRIYDHSKALDRLKEQRVFRIHLSHCSHRLPGVIERPAPFEVRILSLAPDLALLVAGERFRVAPILAPKLQWRLSGRSEATLLAATSVEEYRNQTKRIQAFERGLPSGFRAYFAADDTQRVFDRAVIIADGLDGSAVIEELAQELGVALESAGGEGLLEATSPCRWNQPRFTAWLCARGDAEVTVRGLIMISPSVIDDELPVRLVAVAKRLFELQAPSVGVVMPPG